MDKVTTKAKMPEPIADDGCLSNVRLAMRFFGVVCEGDGSMVIETAFVLPTFFLLLFGIFEFSMLLTGYCSAAYAVRMGARYASIHSSTSIAPTLGSTANVQGFVQANLFAPGSSSIVTPVVTYTPSNSNVVGSVVNVTASWSQSINLPGYHSTISLSTQASRVIVR